MKSWSLSWPVHKNFLMCRCLKFHYIFLYFGSKHHTVSYILTPRSSLFRNASLDASQLSAWSACSLNSCSWCACTSFCRRSSHATPNVRLNSSRCARLGARSSWPPPTGRRIPKFFRDLKASCRPSISAWSKCDYKASGRNTNSHLVRKLINQWGFLGHKN